MYSKLSGRESVMNRVLEDSTYPGKKLVPSYFCKKIVKNATTYTWDW